MDCATGILAIQIQKDLHSLSRRGVRMSKFDCYFLMNTEDIADYVREKTDLFSPNEQLQVKEIGDGNLNYVFLVKGEQKSIIVKQAGETLRISDKMRISTDRNRIEAEILEIQNQYAPGLVPKIYGYDTVMCAMLMEDLSHFRLMRYALIDFEIFPHFVEHITTYMANTLLATTDVVMSPKEKKKLQKRFVNPELCEITEDLVLTEPYNNCNNRNIVFAPLTEFVNKELYEDKTLHLDIAKLKFAFMTNAQALLHGDLHTGSIFVTPTETKIFDPEFAFYGPIGYDIGNVIANLIFAWNRGVAYDKHDFCEWILESIERVVDLFSEKFMIYFKENATDYMAKTTENFAELYLADVLSDTASYAGTELIRRTVGMAQVKDINSIEDEQKRAIAQKINILCAKKLIMDSKSFKIGKDFTKALLSTQETI